MDDAPVGIDTTVPGQVSLADRAYYELRARIVSLHLPPGGPVNEKAVMEDLGISRTPVREALLRLEQERLVAIMPGRGTFVTQVNLSEVGSIFEFRGGLESMAAELAAQRRTAADIERLDPLIEAVSEIADTSTPDPDTLRQMAVDQQAHALIHELARNPLIERALDSHYMLTARIWSLSSPELVTDKAFATMADTLEAIRAGRADAAFGHARDHGLAAEQAVSEALSLPRARRGRSI